MNLDTLFGKNKKNKPINNYFGRWDATNHPAYDKEIFFLQIPCATLHEVIDALVDKTAGTLQPFLLEEPYEENISEET